MNNVEQFEIEWRRLLIKNLQPLLTKLNKAADGDIQAVIDRQSEIRELYPTQEDAHEAFGQGWITEDEYRSIVEMLETETVTHATAARDELKSLMNRYRREIKDFEFEALPEAEKQRIREQQEQHRQEHERGMKLWREKQN
jgi:hypothetical protein